MRKDGSSSSGLRAAVRFRLSFAHLVWTGERWSPLQARGGLVCDCGADFHSRRGGELLVPVSSAIIGTVPIIRFTGDEVTQIRQFKEARVSDLVTGAL